MNLKFSKAFFLLALFMFSCVVLKSQTKKKYSKEVENKITQVENHLASWVEIENTSKWNLKERMI